MVCEGWMGEFLNEKVISDCLDRWWIFLDGVITSEFIFCIFSRESHWRFENRNLEK
jgi:hypothetical protein